MKAHRTFSLVMACVVLAFGCISCSDDSSSSGSPGGTIPPIGELVGSWAGYFLAGPENMLTDDEDLPANDGEEFLEYDDNDIFVVGVVAQGSEPGVRRARFIGDDTLFVSDELNVNDLLGVRAFLRGDFDYYTWNASGVDPYAVSADTISLSGNAVFSTYFLEGLYWHDPEDREYWPFQLFSYNATSTVLAADVTKLQGEWAISDAFMSDNILEFTVTPQGEGAQATAAAIEGGDLDGNLISGTIVEISYADLAGAQSVDIYEVAIDLATGSGTYSLNGLATYYFAFDEDGNIDERALAIGVSDEEGTHMITGLAAPVVEE